MNVKRRTFVATGLAALTTVSIPRRRSFAAGPADVPAIGLDGKPVALRAGEIDEAAVLKQASDDDKRTEARCYLGIHHALGGRKPEALAHFRWVKEHGNPSTFEYRLAVAELDRLAGQ